ncbi:MAG: DUF3473 domain-containing protein [Phycisphaerae bacterium]|nr:DUF3473 domain-containing protein [Phycisphaerae bacterium]
MNVLHGLSIDLEDWYQSTIDPSAELSARFEANTEKMLESFAARGVRATFFVLGLAAEKSPGIVRAVRDAGHEVQSHGYGHVEVFHLTREQFHQDLLRAKGLLEDLTGREIFGYRAPSFSLDHRTPWAWDVLAETGHRYDSSVFPIEMRRYGIADYPLEPRIVDTPEGRRIVEAPIAVFQFMGRRVPVGGGGYVRLWPYWILRNAWRQMERANRPGVLYMHPYEYDPGELKSYRGQVGWKTRLHQGLGRKKFPRKVDRLCGDFHFGPLCETLMPWLESLTIST